MNIERSLNTTATGYDTLPTHQLTLGELALVQPEDLNCRYIIPPHTTPIVLTGPRDIEKQDRDLEEIYGL